MAAYLATYKKIREAVKADVRIVRSQKFTDYLDRYDDEKYSEFRSRCSSVKQCLLDYGKDLLSFFEDPEKFISDCNGPGVENVYIFEFLGRLYEYRLSDVLDVYKNPEIIEEIHFMQEILNGCRYPECKYPINFNAFLEPYILDILERDCDICLMVSEWVEPDDSLDFNAADFYANTNQLVDLGL